jgi:uncharacterized protein (DUF4415 family)
MINNEKDIDFGEKEFKKRFKQIDRASRPNAAIDKALRESKNRISICLDADIIEYFKKLAEETNTGYQTLINKTLREKVDGIQKSREHEDFLERLLNDKDALSRLKTELEAV